MSGEFEIGSQYHFHLETQSCLVLPREEGQFEIHSATQYIYYVQHAVSNVLNVPSNKLDFKVLGVQIFAYTQSSQRSTDLLSNLLFTT